LKRIRAIVTGASSGIGRATAIALAEEGCEVILAARRRDALEELAATNRLFQVRVCDVGIEADCLELVSAARDESGDCHPVLVNAAGIAEFGPFDEMGWESITDHFKVNVLGPILLTQAALPWILEHGEGHVVNVLSIAATNPFLGAAVYCASKSALHMFGRSIAAEYRSRGVRVTSLLPGSTDTSLWDGKGFVPNRLDMLSAVAVGECIRDVVLSPMDRSYDEIVLMPPKGIL
jgi:short-subunit dehydrogenase